MSSVRPVADFSRAWVALSGGVDSAVAASLAVAAGFDVVGVTMRLGVSKAMDDAVVAAAGDVAATLQIPHEVVDLGDAFAHRVVEPFIEAYMRGETPNPCVLCNVQVKFGLLLDAALSGGADLLVTGHYARVEESGGRRVLLRGVDESKDQSYFLYRLVGERLGKLWFPLGGMRKAQVRERAASLGLPCARRGESQDVCFLAGTGIKSFLRARGVTSPSGDIVDVDGTVVGSHGGVWGFTVGQRKGIGVGGGPARYVISIDAPNARVVVGPAEHCLTRAAFARDVVWDDPYGDRRVESQIRYRTAPVASLVHASHDALTVEFDSPVSGVAPGQSIVCYDGARVIGGGYLTGAS